MSRYEFNKMILKRLEKEVEKDKDIRFIQLLWKLDIISNEDRFYEESKDTFSKLTSS